MAKSRRIAMGVTTHCKLTPRVHPLRKRPLGLAEAEALLKNTFVPSLLRDRLCVGDRSVARPRTKHLAVIESV